MKQGYLPDCKFVNGDDSERSEPVEDEDEESELEEDAERVDVTTCDGTSIIIYRNIAPSAGMP